MRMQRYDLEDGLIEIIGGFYLLLIGFIILGPIAFGTTASMPMSLLVLMTPTLLFGPFLKFLKTRFTYPRTGFVAPRPLPNNTRAVILIGGVVLVVATAGVASLVVISDAINGLFLYSIWAIISMGLPISLGCAFTAYRYRLPRFWGLAGLTLVGALAGVMLPKLFALSDGLTLLIFPPLLGVDFLVSGMVTFGRYLRHTHYLDQE